jgi:hypothetical protein
MSSQEYRNYNMGNTTLSATFTDNILKEFSIETCWEYDDWEFPFEIAKIRYTDLSEQYSIPTYTPKCELTSGQFESLFIKRHGYRRNNSCLRWVPSGVC